MAAGQAKVLIMHGKLSEDKVLHIEELWHSSRGFAALLEGNLNEAAREWERVQRSHAPHPTHGFLT